jgi:hypothetical protein
MWLDTTSYVFGFVGCISGFSPDSNHGFVSSSKLKIKTFVIKQSRPCIEEQGAVTCTDKSVALKHGVVRSTALSLSALNRAMKNEDSL